MYQKHAVDLISNKMGFLFGEPQSSFFKESNEA